MKIKALVENQSNGLLAPKHGLSLYIETIRHKLLFDLGPDDTLFENACACQIDLSQVDTVIISHGHSDHGGALRRFLQVNSTAKIYVQKKAFLPHSSQFLLVRVNVGLDEKLQSHPQIVLVDGSCRIDEELSLFTISQTDKCHSKANDCLYEEDQPDLFLHEQSLIISERQTAVIMGCGHTGIVNIMEAAASCHPKYCIGGYHLFNPFNKKTEPDTLLNEIAEELKQYPEVKFYTCHCTGTKAFRYLSQTMPNMYYLSCGDQIEITEDS